MALAIEFLRPDSNRVGSHALIELMFRAAVGHGHDCAMTDRYSGGRRILCLYGPWHPSHAVARLRHVENGGRCLMFDAGYFERRGTDGYKRVSIDHDHPQAYIDDTVSDRSRFDRLGLTLANKYDPDGPIILVGLGPKSRSYLAGVADWEVRKLAELKAQYPGRRIIYRPKPRRQSPRLPCETDDNTPIESLLRGASMVVARHSNVTVDAVIAGVPSLCYDGAAIWLSGKEFNAANRLDFLRRLSWWQWRPSEAPVFWDFISPRLE